MMVRHDATALLKQIVRADLLGGDATMCALADEEWTGVLAAAAETGFAPLLYAALRRLHLADAAPTPIVVTLRAVLQRLIADEVRVVVLKGVALGSLLYHDPAIRPMSDIDLLVPDAFRAQAMAALTELGYVRCVPLRVAEFVLEEEGELGFVKKSVPGAVIDLHWHVFTVPGYTVGALTTWFWENTRLATIVDAPALVFGYEALLLHLSVHHYVHHVDHSLRRLLDVALLLHRHGEELDVELLWRGACAIGMGHLLERMLRDVQDEWGVSTEALMERMRRVDVDMDAVARAPAGADIDVLHTPLRHLAIGLSMTNVWRGVRYVLGYVFPHAPYMRRRYGMRHGWQAPYFYAMRIGKGMRLLWSHQWRRHDIDRR